MKTFKQYIAENNVVDFGEKKKEKKVGEFAETLRSRAETLSSTVKKRVAEQKELVRQHRERGGLPLDVGVRFHTPFTIERNEPPYEVIGHYVNPLRKGKEGPTKTGYYVQRKMADGLERSQITDHDGTKHWGATFMPLTPLKQIKEESKSPAWQRKEGKNPSGGLNKKGVESYRRQNPESNLQTAVTTDPSKLKPGSKKAKRRLSFCRRMEGMKQKLTSKETARDPDSRINKSLRKWNC